MSEARAELSSRQKNIILFIRDFSKGHGYPPTVREIGRACTISSTSVVDYNLKVLRRLGFIRRDADVSRGIELIDRGEEWSGDGYDSDGAVIGRGLRSDEPERLGLAYSRNTVRVPVVGTIAAGEPIEAIESVDEQIEVGYDFAEEGAFALRVRGKSMIEDLIDDGDVVIVRPQETASNGDIVVALILDSPTGSGLATLKRFHRERDRIRLQPANSEMSPIYVSPENLKIQGRVTALIRRL